MMENDRYDTAEDLIQRVSQSTSPFHTVLHVIEELETAGFTELKMSERWEVEEGGCYYVSSYDSSLFAFVVGDMTEKEGLLKIAAAHTDFPCFRLKPQCEIRENGYAKLNVEVYGGPILNTWMDRPLSVAGKVALRSRNILKPYKEFVDIQKPVLTIPNLAIHLNRDVNRGVELNRQKDMLPIFATAYDRIDKEADSEQFFDLLSEHLSADRDSILDYELYVYQTEPGDVVGLTDEFISSPRLDNITSVHACVKSIISRADSQLSGLNCIGLFDNEEVGSLTKQGAASSMFSLILERLYNALGYDRDRLNRDIFSGLMLSTDVAHGLHPNVPEKNDPTNRVYLNNGVVIKIAANQSYANDCEAVGVVMQLCENADIPYQKYVNRSDGTYGKTLGSIASACLPIRTIDIGVPLLAMHSARELMGIRDQIYLETLIEEFFGA